MSGRMIAIALDSVGDDQITDFFSKGYMPNLKRLSEGGVRCRLESQIDIQGHRLPYKSTEGCWVMAQTGVGPDTSNLWHAIQYDPEAYQIRNDHKSSAYDYVEYPPFYDLGDDYGVGIMDLNSGRILPAQKGKQVLGWGGHFPFVVQGSKPEGLLEQIKRRHGENPVYLKDAGVFWNPEYHQWLMEATLRALDQREAIINEFLQDPDLDLIMASIGETHSVLHEFWASVYPDHPLHEEGNSYSDAYEKVFSRTDRLIGSLMDQIKEEDTLAVYSVHGMKANSTDLPCLFFLAEMMYRLEFPGQAAISYSPAGGPVPPLITEGKHSYWFGDVWSQRVADWAWAQGWVERVPAWAQGFWSSKDLIYPFSMDLGGPESGWMPANWYRRLWPQMRAFTFPSFTEGYVRINLKGREGCGIVDPADYESECARVEAYLWKWKNPRTGRPVVQEIIRTRDSPVEENRYYPDADLLVVWSDEPFDVVEHPEAGRIGPVPYYRPGGHRPGGALLISGPGVPKGLTLPAQNIYDLPPTFLYHLGAPIPERMEGKVITAPENIA